MKLVDQLLADWNRTVQDQDWDAITDQLMFYYPAVLAALKNVLDSCDKADRLETRWVQPKIETRDVRRAIAAGLQPMEGADEQ